MSNRSSPVPLPHGPPRAIGSPEEFAERAVEHARDRLFTACEAIAMIGALAAQWTKPWTPNLSLVRAAIQDGSAGAGEQAAHVLPGQILIDGKTPWSIARSDRAIAAFIARFEVTAAVPSAFNVADSEAEKAGLKSAFLRACERAWVSVAAGTRDLTPIFETFLEDATRAFEKAELAKGERSTTAMRRGDGSVSDERLYESLILRLYRVHGVTAKEASRRFRIAT
jgi:hypothetical protein